MEKYEAVFILNTRKISDDSEGHASKIEKILKKYEGKLVSKNDLGRKKFARAIGKRKIGSYWSYVIEINKDSIAEFQNDFRLDEVVIRLVVFKYNIPENPKTLKMEIKQ